MKDSYNTDEYVVYARSGVCKIESIKNVSFGSGKKEPYYILKPVNGKNSTVYVPYNNKGLVGKMRYAMTKAEVDDTISKAKNRKLDWIEDKDMRTKQFQEILTSGCQLDLMMLARCINNKKQELIDNGKKLCMSEENILKSSEKLLDDEFSFSLKMPMEQVGEYILERLGSNNN